eukprot:IDg20405t1
MPHKAPHPHCILWNYRTLKSKSLCHRIQLLAFILPQPPSLPKLRAAKMRIPSPPAPVYVPRIPSTSSLSSSTRSSRGTSWDSDCESVQRIRSRRDTFSFAEVLYQDGTVEITPSSLTVIGGSRFSRRIIDVHAVRSVWRPLYGDAFAASRPTWWQRAALGRRRPHNLVVDVLNPNLASLPLTVDEPDAFERAISKAQA